MYISSFTMQVDIDIKDMTFLAEYAGDVDYLENRANDDCDCIMTLLLADPSQGLVISLTSGGTFLALSVASTTTHYNLFVLYPKVRFASVVLCFHLKERTCVF